MFLTFKSLTKNWLQLIYFYVIFVFFYFKIKQKVSVFNGLRVYKKKGFFKYLIHIVKCKQSPNKKFSIEDFLALL